MNNNRHYIAAISAFVIWGFFSIPLRAIKEYSAGEILYFRILFSLAILLVVVAAFKRAELLRDWNFFRSLSSKEKRNVVMLTLLGGALLSVNWLVFIYIVNAINIKTASFSYLICPVITAVLGYVLIKERLTRLQWIAVGLCGVSCLLMGISSVFELGYSFLTAASYALYLISQRRNQGFDRMVSLLIQVLFSFVILNVLFNFLVTEIPVSGNFYGIILIIAALFTVLPLFLNLFALNRINSATIGILMYLNPLVNFSVAFIRFKETIDIIQAIGYSIIVIALVLFNHQTFRRKVNL